MTSATTNHPSVSVVIAARNCSHYLGAAIDSALGQTLSPHQVLVVDDGSTDDTPERCAAYEGRITYVHQENSGAAAARNTALDLATGQYIAMLDADDVCAADRLEKQVMALEHRSEAVACYSGHWIFDEAAVIRHCPLDPAVAAEGTLDFLCRLLVLPMTMTFRRDAAVGLYFPVGVRTGEDHIFMAHLRHRGPVVVLPEMLYGYRRHAAQITAGFREIDSLRQRLDWAREHGAAAWPELAYSAIEAAMWDATAQTLVAYWWARRERAFRDLQVVLRGEWPSHLPRPAVLEWHWYPDWLWRCRSWLGRLRVSAK